MTAIEAKNIADRNQNPVDRARRIFTQLIVPQIVARINEGEYRMVLNKGDLLAFGGREMFLKTATYWGYTVDQQDGILFLDWSKPTESPENF